MAHPPRCLRPAAARTLSRTFVRGTTYTRPVFFANSTLRHHSSFASPSNPSSSSSSSSSPSASVSADELSHFSALASSWWDPMGPSRVLHLMNPLRHDFIAECLAEAHPRYYVPPQATDTAAGDASAGAETSAKQQEGLRYLDVGCGGGIFAESLARTIPLSSSSAGTATATDAASILAIDPSTTLIRIARDHARTDPTLHEHLRSGRFRYENTTIEALSSPSPSTSTPEAENTNPASGCGSGERKEFDVITLFEVLEHVESPLSFLTHTLRLLRPGGWLIGSTIARTFPSWLVNQVIAEAPWPIGVVPRGTHEWSKFVNPDEARGWVEEALMRAKDGAVRKAGSEALDGMRWKCAGVMYFPGIGWRIVRGTESWGNYFWAVRKGV
ncbi:hypothetical protein VTN00DRAFT_10165 [Thermoascus crustaceus]|uniref:uncharacterized protein n=1 Tax=Thermoascus crustaceus TaxID=5088 RepID=UPI003742D9EC